MRLLIVALALVASVACSENPLAELTTPTSVARGSTSTRLSSDVIIPDGPNSCPDGAYPKGLAVNSHGRKALIFWLPEATIEVYEIDIERSTVDAQNYRHEHTFMTTGEGMQGPLFHFGWRLPTREAARFRVRIRTKSACDTFGPWSPFVTFETGQSDSVPGSPPRVDPVEPDPVVIDPITGIPVPPVPPVVPVPPVGSFYALGPNIQAFGMLAGSAITCTASTVTGDVGVSPGSSITGFPGLCSVSGTIRSTASSVAAQADLAAAYAEAVSLPCTPIGANLNGVTLTPGVYCSGALTSNLTGTLTLDGAGDYIIRFPSTLITSSGSNVNLINGATCGGVNYVVGSSATLAGNLTGNVIAFSSITMNPGATTTGRLLARNAAVTITTSTLTNAGCN